MKQRILFCRHLGKSYAEDNEDRMYITISMITHDDDDTGVDYGIM